MKRTPAPVHPLPPHPGVLQLLGVTLLVLAPLAVRLPWWVSTAVAATALWRALAALRGWPLPNGWLRGALTVAGLVLVQVYFGRINGLAAGSALLAIATALKLTELRDRRDLRILIALLYFTLVVNFLYSQEIWTLVYLLGCTWLITAVLVASNHTAGALPTRTSLRMAAVLGAQALPLMIVMFVLFPRLPGPLWGLPTDSGALTSGMSNAMSPGDVSRLALSDAIAFRVAFEGTAPPPAQRYWRGPVFTHYDGHTWTPGPLQPTPRYTTEGEAVHYRMTLEASRTRWLFALDLPDTTTLPKDTTLDGHATLLANHDNRTRRVYALVSWPHYRLAPRLSATQRRMNLELPAGFDPRTRALAQGWRDSGLSPSEIIAAALRFYRDGHFLYTLEPPPVGRNAIDDFLFNTRAGFCEHFAGSFTFLMRAAGIPARVVTGYQGGEKNPFANYYTIRQKDAHAWTEVWLAERGWVRIDPTAIAAPQRIDAGVNAALAGIPGLPAFLTPRWGTSWRYTLQARWDWANQRWNEFVLGYGPELQQRFLSHFGLADVRRMLLALTAAIAGLLALLGLALLRTPHHQPRPDAALKLWHQGTRRLRRFGLVQSSTEGPQDFAHRAARLQPRLASWLGALATAYVQARYAGSGADDALARLRTLARAPLPHN
ncbi:MAG: DUF3488 domain-containing protein [Nevskiaceae bacterium]|nr:MAG: DUF3488 domain-containing protein [Nevskiaceae bacterium]TBR74677.1 MAG: DUF3488 domain-containing protein [Nevskiaceae bacterium]